MFRQALCEHLTGATSVVNLDFNTFLCKGFTLLAVLFESKKQKREIYATKAP